MNDFQCIDSKTLYCPCPLSELQSCLVCSMLQGKDYCDCHWQGICIYQNYLWKNKTIKKRESMILDVMDKKYIADSLVILKIKIKNPNIPILCNQPGSYAFLKACDKPDFYNVPLCIMDVNKNVITFAIDMIGPKTKCLEKAKSISFRGPYYNGLYGLKYVNSSFKKQWLIIGRGTGQVPLVLLTKKLLKNKNQLIVFLDPGLSNINIVWKKLLNLGVEPQNINLDNITDEQKIESIVKNGSIDFICSCGSDLQHKKLQNLIDKNRKDIPLIISNNQKLCCGEGVCGSCKVISNSKTLSMCKMQLDSKKFLGGFNNA